MSKQNGAELTFIVDGPEGNILQILIEFDVAIPRAEAAYVITGLAKGLKHSDPT